MKNHSTCGAIVPIHVADGYLSSKKRSVSARLCAMVITASVLVSQAACTTGQEELSTDDKLAIGAVAGAVVGGLIGYEYFGNEDSRLLWALGLGAAGAYGGKMLADNLTRYDKTSMQQTTYQSLTQAPAGETATWKNNATGTHGSITPMRTFLNAQGRICREYDAEVNVDGNTVSGRETACLTEAGHWVVYATTG
ncbi:MAG: RT0821/Lpp0805 family surface protein [Alphaproteobacteria bacterium]|nr:RT0821/Lpp0805 family surface protein [Alphaproteobacteria bacterium]